MDLDDIQNTPHVVAWIKNLCPDCRMEYNPDLVPCGSKPRPSTDPLWSPWWSPPAARPPCSYYLHRRPPRLHLREDLLRVSVNRCRTRALDSLFKNQTVINHVNRKGLSTKTVLRVLSPKIDENNFGQVLVLVEKYLSFNTLSRINFILHLKWAQWTIR